MSSSYAVRDVLSSMEKHMEASLAPVVSAVKESAAPESYAQLMKPKNIRNRGKPSWGPTHSDSNFEEDEPVHTKSNPANNNNNDRTETTKEETISCSGERSPLHHVAFPLPMPHQTTLDRLYESAQAAVNIITPSPASLRRATSCLDDDTEEEEDQPSTIPKNLTDLFQKACRPCTPQTVDAALAQATRACHDPPLYEDDASSLGMGPMSPPPPPPRQQEEALLSSRSSSLSTPASRRRQRHLEKLQRLPPPPPLPLDELEVSKTEADILERSISELTMRSSHGEAVHGGDVSSSSARRMAYYAVGKHHHNRNASSKRAGNRRCYFTGKLILGGAPFYAGSVQQGLRTLVVFCLPSSIGLPEGVEIAAAVHANANAQAFLREASLSSLATSRSGSKSRESTGIVPRLSLRKRRTQSSHCNDGSRVSSRPSSDEMSFDEDYDPNCALDREYLLQVLPEPSQELLDKMAQDFPEEFETLPVQVRSPHCWRLFVKFCFFSGLPIAEGEMHYKVRDEVANEVYGEEIILSHEVMEAVNGESAEILRLPNQKTFKYLKRHYTQQSGKLSEVVFRRESWEIVLPEI